MVGTLHDSRGGPSETRLFVGAGSQWPSKGVFQLRLSYLRFRVTKGLDLRFWRKRCLTPPLCPDRSDGGPPLRRRSDP